MQVWEFNIAQRVCSSAALQKLLTQIMLWPFFNKTSDEYDCDL